MMMEVYKSINMYSISIGAEGLLIKSQYSLMKGNRSSLLGSVKSNALCETYINSQSAHCHTINAQHRGISQTGE